MEPMKLIPLDYIENHFSSKVFVILTNEQITIGRNSKCEIKDKRISRNHVIVYSDSKNLYAKQVESHNQHLSFFFFII